jgi:hypothetical protein
LYESESVVELPYVSMRRIDDATPETAPFSNVALSGWAKDRLTYILAVPLHQKHFTRADLRTWVGDRLVRIDCHARDAGINTRKP